MITILKLFTALRWNDSVPAVSTAKGLSFEGSGTKDLSNAPRDFVRLNRAAVDAGLTTSRQQDDFRALNDFRRQPKSRNTRADAFALRGPSVDAVYGRPVRLQHSPNWCFMQQLFSNYICIVRPE